MREGLLDHLVGAGEERGWDGQAECPGGLQVDHQLEFGRLLDRQVGGPSTLEDPAAVVGRLTSNGSDVRGIREQGAVVNASLR